MLFGPKKYIFLSVCFQGSRKPAKPADDLAWIDEPEFFDAIFDDR